MKIQLVSTIVAHTREKKS